MESGGSPVSEANGEGGVTGTSSPPSGAPRHLPPKCRGKDGSCCNSRFPLESGGTVETQKLYAFPINAGGRIEIEFHAAHFPTPPAFHAGRFPRRPLSTHPAPRAQRPICRSETKKTVKLFIIYIHIGGDRFRQRRSASSSEPRRRWPR